MSSNSWQQALYTLQVPGPSLASASALSMLVAASPASGQTRFTWPANYWKVGDKIKVKASGIVTTPGASPGTAVIDLRLDSTVIFSTAAAITFNTSQTNIGWLLDVDLTVRSVGAGTAATLWGQGYTASAAYSGGPFFHVPNQAPAISAGFDSTLSHVVDSFFTQTVATASWTCEQFELTLST